MRKRDQVMLCYPYEEKRFLKWGNAIIQPKLDGDRCLAKLDKGQVKLYSSTGIEITSVPHINKELQELLSDVTALKLDLELDGELYLHGMKHPEISGLVRTKWGAPEEAKRLQYHIFDIPTLNETYKDRISTLSQMPLGEAVKRLPTDFAGTINDVSLLLKEYMKQGYEGFVLKDPNSKYERKRSTNWMKYKPKTCDSYLIIGTVEEYSIHNEPKNQLGALILTDETQQFKVGTGFTQQQRKELWKIKEQLPGKAWCTITYQELSKDGIPREPVFVEINV